MKAMITGLLLASLLMACGNEKTTDSTEVESAPVTPGVDNVNGNVPDTTAGIRLNSPMPKDSSLVNDSPAHR